MKAMCVDENRDFVWRDVEYPACHAEFDVKLKVEACAVNRADLMQRAGIYAPPDGWPLWPGLSPKRRRRMQSSSAVKIAERSC